MAIEDKTVPLFVLWSLWIQPTQQCTTNCEVPSGTTKINSYETHVVSETFSQMER